MRNWRGMAESAPPRMTCAQCECKMTQLPSGAYARCCDGIGYYWSDAPLPKDRWFGAKPLRLGWLYRNWSKNLPAPPKEGER